MKKKSESRDGKTLPLVVCDERGNFLFLSATNGKGFAKSIERGALWTVHPDTDKLLPNDRENTLLKIEEREDYYYAEISLVGGTLPPAATINRGETEKPAERPREAVELPKADPGILLVLAQIVAQRKRDLPEGSYTTHLFTSGIDKIRKKTGEEAVELILAREPGEIVYEAADLIYHLIVLLEAEGIGLDRLFGELDKRTK